MTRGTVEAMNLPKLLLVGLAALLAISLMWPPYPREQWLQHLPTVAALVGLTLAARAHVALERGDGVPRRDDWRCTSSAPGGFTPTCRTKSGATRSFGAGPHEWFGWTRNHYDRLVHLAFGLLMPLPIVEAAMRYGGLSRRWAMAWAIAVVAAVSAVYEVFEWLLAVIAAPEFAEHYNGQQGDAWDGAKRHGPGDRREPDRDGVAQLVDAAKCAIVARYRRRNSHPPPRCTTAHRPPCVRSQLSEP